MGCYVGDDPFNDNDSLAGLVPTIPSLPAIGTTRYYYPRLRYRIPGDSSTEYSGSTTLGPGENARKKELQGNTMYTRGVVHYYAAYRNQPMPCIRITTAHV